MSDRSSNSQNLPHIRDILGAELGRSMSSRTPQPGAHYPGGTAYGSPSTGPATSSPQYSTNYYPPGSTQQRQPPSSYHTQPQPPSRFGAGTPGPGGPHYPGGSGSQRPPSVPTLHPNVDWRTSHTVQASTSSRSQPSPQAYPAPSVGPRSGNHPSAPLTDQYRSPYGTLVEDMRAPGSTPQHSSEYSRTSFPVIPEDQQTNARYICSICGKRFTRPSSLRTHEHSHTGLKPFVCTYPNCGRGFSVQSNMRRHVTKVHERGGSSKQGESSEDEYDDESETCARH